MQEQLSAAFPIHTYPFVILTPDGGVAMSAGKLLVRGSAGNTLWGSTEQCEGQLSMAYHSMG